MSDAHQTPAPLSRPQAATLIAAPLLFIAMLLIPAPEFMTPAGWKTVCVAVLMLCLWVSEAIPIAATALLPIVLLPFLGVQALDDVTTHYAHPLIFLFLGGFIMALAMRKWDLHKRIALNILRITGTNANGIILGFMVATGFLSMWMSNTATTVMMIAIGISILQLLLHADGAPGLDSDPASDLDSDTRAKERRFALGLMLAIAYGANIGGTATLIGTPPNAILAAYLQDAHGITIDFMDWLKIGLPFAAALMAITWALLVYVLVPSRLGRIGHAGAVIESELKAIGRMSRAEAIVLVLFLTMAGLWMFKSLLPFAGLSDTSIAMSIAVLCFAIPVSPQRGEFILSWRDMRDLPWGVLILFGGGLALAGAMQASGLVELIGAFITANADIALVGLIAISSAMVLFLTEGMSNTALATIMLPVLAGVAVEMDINVLLLTIPAALAASCAFMLPMATPPNAIVFASGHIHIRDMVRTGFLINLVSIALITLLAMTLVPLVFGG